MREAAPATWGDYPLTGVFGKDIPGEWEFTLSERLWRSIQLTSGLPIVASDVDGIPECVGRDGAAVLLPPDDPAAWADAVVKIITDKDLANHMAARERERASSLFDIAPLAQQTMEVLKTVYEGYHKDVSFL
jgi:glycosyltransferase involved in cell wall biosynthesis